MPQRIPLNRMYDYRRKLPHYQKPDRAHFITFCRLGREPFPAEARSVILDHCLHDHGKRYQLHAAVVMPEHVHLLLTPLRDEQGWPHGLPAILKLIKGCSARTVNKLGSGSGPVWQEESFDHVLRSNESFAEKLEYIRQNPVRRGLARKPEDYQWLWVEQNLCCGDSGEAERSFRREAEQCSGMIPNTIGA
jgi:REP element-mobilizing transposase RayT